MRKYHHIIRRRRIRNWFYSAIARKDYECEKCGAKISATFYYDRDVFVNGSVLDIERVHSDPGCPDRCY